MVLRVSDTMGKPCVDKVMKIDYGPRDGPPDLKAARMLLVMDPPTEGLGAWATDCWRAFEAELRKYLGGRFGGGDDGDPPM
jgi:hypothetical protein